MVICLERAADLHVAQLMPLLLTVSCFSKIQSGFTFLVPAHLSSPGKRAVKRMCVCVFTWSRVYETVKNPSVCLSVPSDCHMLLLRVCCCGPSCQEISIDCCTAGGPAVTSSRNAAWLAAATAGSAALSADVGS